MTNKETPEIKSAWEHDPTMLNLKTLLKTIRECWEYDADARITAPCLVERIKELKSTTLDSGVGSTASTNGGDTENSSLDGDAHELMPLSSAGNNQ